MWHFTTKQCRCINSTTGKRILFWGEVFFKTEELKQNTLVILRQSKQSLFTYIFYTKQFMKRIQTSNKLHNIIDLNDLL